MINKNGHGATVCLSEEIERCNYKVITGLIGDRSVWAYKEIVHSRTQSCLLPVSQCRANVQLISADKVLPAVNECRLRDNNIKTQNYETAWLFY